MSSEPIDIEVRDKVSTAVRDKLLNIAAAALEGYNSVDKLNNILDKIDGSSVNKLVKAQADLEKQTVKNNLAYLSQETALNKAIAAETAAETAAQKLTTASLQSEAAQNRAAAAAAKTAQASLQAAAAVNAFGESEADVAARLGAVSQAGAALAKQQQSVAITAAQATTAEAGLARATTASATAAQGAAARYSNYMSALNTLGKSNPAAAAMKETEVAANKVSIANAGVTRELIVLGHEAISGNFSRIPGSMLVLAERVNGVGAALSALLNFLGPVGTVLSILALAGTALAAALGLAENANKKLQNGLSLTGFIAGVTSESIKDLAKNVAEVNDISVSSAKDIVNQLALSGQFTKEQVSQLAVATVGFERSTKESADKIIKSFDELAKSPLVYAENLARTTDIIKPALLAQLDELDKQGQKTKEVELISRALFDYFNGSARESLTGVSGFWHSLGVTISDTASKLKEFATLDVFSPTQQQQLDSAVNSFNLLQRLQNGLRAIGGQGAANLLQGPIDNQQNKIDGIQAESQALLDKAAATGAARAQDIAANLALKESSTAFDGARGNVEKMNNELTKFRENLKTVADNPRLANTPQAQALFDNQAAIEESIRRKYRAATPVKTPEESRDVIVTKATAELDKQLKVYGEIREVRNALTAVDQLDITLAAKRVNGQKLKPLSDEEKSLLLIKLDQIEVNKRVEASQDAIYATAIGPLRAYNDGTAALDILNKRGLLTTQQVIQAQKTLEFAYQAATDPLFQFNRSIKDQNDLLDANLGVKERAARQAVQQINATLAPQGKELSTDQVAKVERENLALQKRNQLQSAYDTIVAANDGARENLVVQQNALNKAYSDGKITLDQYATSVTQLAIQKAQLNLDTGVGTQVDLGLASIGKLLDGYKGVLSGLSKGFGDFFTSLEQGFADSAAHALVFGGSAKAALLDVARNAVSALLGSLIKLGIQWAVTAAFSKESTATDVAGSAAKTAAITAATAAQTLEAVTAIETVTLASSAAAAELAVAWAPAAAAVAIATFGASADAALISIAAAYALTEGLSATSLAGFESGGYTGNVGTGQIAGVVHGQEFVMNAAATRNNLGTLQAMNAGGSPSGGSVKVSIANYGTSKDFEVVPVSADEVRIIARDEATAAVRRDAPGVVAADMSNPNSKTSKATQRNFTVSRNRNA